MSHHRSATRPLRLRLPGAAGVAGPNCSHRRISSLYRTNEAWDDAWLAGSVVSVKRASFVIGVVTSSVWLLACSGGSSDAPSGAGQAGSGAGTASGGSGGSSSTGTVCQAQVQTGTRTECDFSQGISDPDIACDDVPVYGYVDGEQCAGSCVDVKTSASHCGECGNACDTGNAWYCKDGKCTDPRQGAGGAGGSSAGGSGGNGATSGSGGGAPQLPDLGNVQLGVGYVVAEAGECVPDIGCAYDVNVCLETKNANFLSVQNLGNADAPPFALKLAFEADGKQYPCVTENALATTSALAPLATWKLTDELCCTASLLLPGQYRLALTADPDNAVPESDELNNAGYTDSVTITP